MSYFPDLLIETYHLLIEEASVLERAAVAVSNINVRESNNVYVTAIKLIEKAEEIKKRMKSLGYHDCWEKEDRMEVELP